MAASSASAAAYTRRPRVVTSRRGHGADARDAPARAWAPPCGARVELGQLALGVVEPSERDERGDEVGAPRLRALRQPDATQPVGQRLQRRDDGESSPAATAMRAVAATTHSPPATLPVAAIAARRPAGGAAPLGSPRAASTEAATPWAIGLDSSWPESSSIRARSTAIANASSHRPWRYQQSASE